MKAWLPVAVVVAAAGAGAYLWWRKRQETAASALPDQQPFDPGAGGQAFAPPEQAPPSSPLPEHLPSPNVSQAILDDPFFANLRNVGMVGVGPSAQTPAQRAALEQSYATALAAARDKAAAAVRGLNMSTPADKATWAWAHESVRTTLQALRSNPPPVNLLSPCTPAAARTWSLVPPLLTLKGETSGSVNSNVRDQKAPAAVVARVKEHIGALQSPPRRAAEVRAICDGTATANLAAMSGYGRFGFSAWTHA